MVFKCELANGEFDQRLYALLYRATRGVGLRITAVIDTPRAKRHDHHVFSTEKALAVMQSYCTAYCLDELNTERNRRNTAVAYARAIEAVKALSVED